MRGIGDASDQRGQQQHAGYGGELQFADLPQPFGLVLLALLTLLGAVLVLVVAVPRVLGLVPLTILSGSMEPTLPVGSQVFVDPVESAEQAREEVTVARASSRSCRWPCSRACSSSRRPAAPTP